MAFRSATSTMPSDNPATSPSIQGQKHDRFEPHGVALGEPDENINDVVISLGQKMMSAVAGSLITSLLGKDN
jgi:hypothetical protein